MDHLSQKKKWKRRLRMQRSTRSRQRKHSERPRLSVHRSAKNISVQLIDDAGARTLAAASTMEPGLRGKRDGQSKTEQAREVGALIGARAREAGVEEVRLDRGWYRYHGRVRALADAAREAGLKF